jgi:hypothetical protein
MDSAVAEPSSGTRMRRKGPVTCPGSGRTTSNGTLLIRTISSVTASEPGALEPATSMAGDDDECGTAAIGLPDDCGRHWPVQEGYRNPGAGSQPLRRPIEVRLLVFTPQGTHAVIDDGQTLT